MIAAGMAICGVSAIAATNTVTRARDEDFAYSIAAITKIGSMAMFLHPVVQLHLYKDPLACGLWAGRLIHEVAQVTGATIHGGKIASDFGIIAKLSCVMMLVSLVALLGVLATLRLWNDAASLTASVPMPWLIFTIRGVRQSE